MDEFSTLIQVILIDLLFAGDNAIAVGLVAAGLPKSQRTKVIAAGIGLAVILRIIFAVATVQLLKNSRPAATWRTSTSLGKLATLCGSSSTNGFRRCWGRCRRK